METTTEFQTEVFDYVRKIPLGEVRTYGEIAKALGNPNAYRTVANALQPLQFEDYPEKHDVPFWRVVLADGSVNRADIEKKFPEGVEHHRQVLRDEGVVFTEDGRVAALVSRKRGGTKRTPRRPNASACWRHEKVQYTCRDCCPVGIR